MFDSSLKTGTIMLISEFEEVVSSKQYTRIYHRKEIIGEWKKIYGERFNRCAIQIHPTTNIQKIGKNGENIRMGAGKKIKNASRSI